jgi:hypothetical protein
MSNMSYCRFHNTLGDLRDCLEHLEEKLDPKNDSDEYHARERLIKLCCDIAQDFGDLDFEKDFRDLDFED